MATDLDRAGADTDVARRAGAVTLADQERSVGDAQGAADIQEHVRATAQTTVTAGQEDRDDTRHRIGPGRHVAAHGDIDQATMRIAEGLGQQTARRKGKLAAPDEDRAAGPVAEEAELVPRVAHVDKAPARDQNTSQCGKTCHIDRTSAYCGLTGRCHTGQADFRARRDDGRTAINAFTDGDVAANQRKGLAGRHRRWRIGRPEPGAFECDGCRPGRKEAEGDRVGRGQHAVLARIGMEHAAIGQAQRVSRGDINRAAHLQRCVGADDHPVGVDEIEIGTRNGHAQRTIDEAGLEPGDVAGAAGHTRNDIADTARALELRAFAAEHVEDAETVEQVRAACRALRGADRHVTGQRGVGAGEHHLAMGSHGAGQQQCQRPATGGSSRARRRFHDAFL